MGPTSSTNKPISEFGRYRDILINLANDAIVEGLKTDHCLTVDPTDFPAALQVQRASFVTLLKAGQLRGCIGSLEAIQALVVDIASNAYRAAFSDPRFQPLSAEEYEGLEVHLSILSRPEPLEVSSEEDLIQKLQPEYDGLIMSYGQLRGTYLPSVWGSLSDPRAFVRSLKSKTGLPTDFWSDELRFWRYHTEMIQ